MDDETSATRAIEDTWDAWDAFEELAERLPARLAHLPDEEAAEWCAAVVNEHASFASVEHRAGLYDALVLGVRRHRV
jgi:hypothetical protein